VQKRKLIEVALPLEAINRESARENYIYRGNPSSVHKWWTQKPLAAARAVLFAQLVDDPSGRPDEFPTEELQRKERERLHKLIERLVIWENTHDEKLLADAHAEILKSTDGNPPPIFDPAFMRKMGVSRDVRTGALSAIRTVAELQGRLDVATARGLMLCPAT
jgi:putative DNA methylase